MNPKRLKQPFCKNRFPCYLHSSNFSIFSLACLALPCLSSLVKVNKQGTLITKRISTDDFLKEKTHRRSVIIPLHDSTKGLKSQRPLFTRFSGRLTRRANIAIRAIHAIHAIHNVLITSQSRHKSRGKKKINKQKDN